MKGSWEDKRDDAPAFRHWLVAALIIAVLMVVLPIAAGLT